MLIDKLLKDVSSGLKAVGIAREIYAAELAPDFSVFEYLSTRETGLSNILQSILDPKGKHNQGDVFLRKFLERFSDIPRLASEKSLLGKASVRKEHPTTKGRRIDIVIDIEGFLIGIENKPWAADGLNQIHDYVEYLSGKARPNKWLLIYLSFDGRDLSSIDLDEWKKKQEEGHVSCTAYSELTVWLDECVALCKAANVRFFLREFKSYIRREFEGFKDMQEENEIFRSIVESPENLAAALQVMRSSRAVKKNFSEISESSSSGRFKL